MKEELTTNPFAEYADILEGIDATPDDAASRMWENYEDAITNYTKEAIEKIFALNLVANKKKYEDMLHLYVWDYHPFVDKFYDETYSHTRTPNLESTSTGTGSGSTTTERKQSRTTTNSPGVTTTTTHSVQPYDSSGMRVESSNVTGETGSNTQTESFSGQPDTMETESTANSTVTTTGSDLNEYDKKYIGRTGNKPTSEVIADGLKAAAMHDVLDKIIEDLAQQIFIQAWII